MSDCSIPSFVLAGIGHCVYQPSTYAKPVPLWVKTASKLEAGDMQLSDLVVFGWQIKTYDPVTK